MNEKANLVNHFLRDVFNEILKTEEECLASSSSNLSLKEMHVIEAVDDAQVLNTDNRSTAIASVLRITPGTLTTAVSLLEKKGYLVRKKDDVDRRIVRLYVTEKGKQICELHHKFHDEMVHAIVTTLNSEELHILTKGLKKLSDFFHGKKYTFSKI